MKVEHTCKFCHKPITLNIDDAYMNLGDYLDLLPLAACNRCADLRVERRKLEDAIQRACMQWFQKTQATNPKQEDRSTLRQSLTDLTKRYSEWLRRFKAQPKVVWDSILVDALIERPLDWYSIITDYSKIFDKA